MSNPHIIYAEHQGKRDRWPIGKSVERPTPGIIQRAGIDPGSVLHIKIIRPAKGQMFWLVELPRDSRREVRR